jgi:hypothetical protein
MRTKTDVYIGSEPIRCRCRIVGIRMEIDGLQEAAGNFHPSFELNSRTWIRTDEPEEVRRAVRTLEKYAAKRYDGELFMGRRIVISTSEDKIGIAGA